MKVVKNLLGLAMASGLSLGIACNEIYDVPISGNSVPRQNEVFGQQGEICEDTLKVDPRMRTPPESFNDLFGEEPFFTYEFGNKIGQVEANFVLAYPGEPQPITSDWSIRRLENGNDRLEVYLWTNGDVKSNGEMWTFNIVVRAPTGEILMPKKAPEIVTNGVSIQHFYTVKSDCDFVGLRNNLNELEQIVNDHINQPVPPAHTPSQPPAQSTLNNGICGDNINDRWDTEYGCEIPSGIYVSNVNVRITNLSGEEVNTLMPGQQYLGKAFVGSGLVRALEARGKTIPIPNLKETGDSDCAYVVTGSTDTRNVSEGIERVTSFTFLVNSGCTKGEVVEYSLSFGNDPVSGSELRFVDSVNYFATR